MNAIELAEYLEDYSEYERAKDIEAATMLRKQHEAIVKLREALAKMKAHATQIETLMALITAAIKLYAYHATDDVMVVDDGKAINAVKAALEAAMKPGVPITWAEAEEITIRPSVEDAIEVLLEDQTLDNATGVVMAVLNAVNPAQTPMQKVVVPPPGVDMQEVMYACGWNDACEKFGNPVYEPTPPVVIEVTHYTDTPPPWLTDDDLMAVHCGGKDMVDGLRAVEKAHGITNKPKE